jgi:hypothetical protein
METYLAPLCMSPTPLGAGGSLGFNWLSVLAGVIITAGQTIASRNT